MKIYGVPLSVHTRKVMVAAQLKNIPFELQVVIPVVPGNPPANWRDISPTGLIPAIDDDGFRLADSTAILHYLERKQPTPSLLPADKQELGAALFLDSWAGSALFRGVVHPIFHNQVVNPNIRKVPADTAAIDAALNKAAPEAFAYLENLDLDACAVGDRLTIADLAIVSNLITYHYLGHRIAPRFAKLNAYFRRHLDSSVLNAALTADRPFVEQMGLDRSFLN
jgi:glutathione S-transferase